MKRKKDIRIRPEKPVLVLRFCKADLSSSHGFVWPEKGPVKVDDWKATRACGNGLHGWLWGAGDILASTYHEALDAKGLVVEIDEYIDLNGKVKFPEGRVVFCGTCTAAASYISAFAPAGTPIIFGTATAGDLGTATAGSRGTATAGYAGTATAGYAGTATAGNRGTAAAGDDGTATAGDLGTAKAGYAGTATAGNFGTATAGDLGTATAGDDGTATAGDLGTATAGSRGTAAAGSRGTAAAGSRGTLIIRYWDDQKGHYRMATAEIGENGIEPNTPYRYTLAEGWKKVE